MKETKKGPKILSHNIHISSIRMLMQIGTTILLTEVCKRGLQSHYGYN
jgi:hypothetical protein